MLQCNEPHNDPPSVSVQGAEAFQPMVATLGALASWTVDDGTVQRRPEQAVTGLAAIFNFVRTSLPKIDGALANKYIPSSFESTYKRAYSNVDGGCVLQSLRAAVRVYTVGIPACACL